MLYIPQWLSDSDASRRLAAELWSRVQQLQDQIQVAVTPRKPGRFLGFCPWEYGSIPIKIPFLVG